MRRISSEGRILIVLFIVVIACAIVFTPRNQDSSSDQFETVPSRSTYSVRPGGCKALYLALQESGYAVSRLRGPWTDLPRPPAVLISLSPPMDPTEKEWDALALWLRDGGFLIIASPQGGGNFVPESKRAWTSIATTVNSGILSGVMHLGTYSDPTHLNPFDPPRRLHLWDNATPLVNDRDRKVASYVTRDRGATLILQAPEIAANDGVARDDNLRFLVNAIGPPTRPIVFDEFHHGYGEASGVWSYMSTSVRFGLIVLGIGGLILLWAMSRRMGAPLPEPVVVHERSEYVDSMAWLLKRANATRLVARLWQRRLRHRLARELGASAQDDLASLAPANAAKQIEDLLQRLDQASAQSRPVDYLLRLTHDEAHLWKELKKDR